jgi:hypothetical protein
MATVNSLDLRITNARNLVADLSDESNSGLAYLFIGKPTPWESGDETPPTPSNNVEEYRKTFDNMLSLKKILDGTVYHLIPRYDWASGIIFDTYNHTYTHSNPAFSGAVDLADAKWVTINQSNNVYICLDNNGNNASTVEPLSTGNTPFYTSDGYQWLHIYTLTASALENYTTPTLIPVIDNETVETVDGAVYTATIDSPGNDYTTSPGGVVNQIPHYYCNITGDGTGAVARVTVTEGSVTKIEIVRYGQNYTYANIDFRTNHVYQSLADLDAESNALNPQGDGTFSSTVIIGPRGGWGSDAATQLRATRVGVFTDLTFDTTDFLTDVSFRQIGILTNAQESSILDNPTTMNATYAVKLTTTNAEAQIYQPGELISQLVTVGGKTKTAWGTVVAWSGDDEINGVLSYIQDPRIKTDTDGGLYRFSGSNFIIGQTTGKVGNIDDLDTPEDDRSFTNGYSNPEVVKYVGEMVQLSNVSPVTRTPSQSEKVTIIISY